MCSTSHISQHLQWGKDDYSPDSVDGRGTWWFIPLSKWVITLVINGISGVSPLITKVITHLLSGMNHQVPYFQTNPYRKITGLSSTGWWFFGKTPLKNMTSSIGMMRFPIYGKIKLMATKPPTSITYHNNLSTCG